MEHGVEHKDAGGDSGDCDVVENLIDHARWRQFRSDHKMKGSTDLNPADEFIEKVWLTLSREGTSSTCPASQTVTVTLDLDSGATYASLSGSS